MRLLFISLLFLGAAAQGESCRKANKGDSCKVEISDLHPTQFNLGIREVRARAAKFADMKAKDLKEYIDDNPIPVILGPKDKLYLIDHHHLARAMELIGQDKLDGALIEDYSAMERDEFWKKMEKKGWVLLADNGKPRSADKLPGSLSEMTDDPYRSLAWSVNKKGGYKDTNVPYADFYWADFFRTRVSLDGKYGDAVKYAVKLAHSPEARGLPGYSH